MVAGLLDRIPCLTSPLIESPTAERERAREAVFWRDRAARGEEQALHPVPPKDKPSQGGPTTSSAFAAATAHWLPPEDRAEGAAAAAATTASSASAAAPSPVYYHHCAERDTPLHQDLFVLCTPQPGTPDRDEDDAGRLLALQLPYLKLQRRTQVGHLRQVLAGMLGLERDPEAVEILCRGEVLMAQHSLHFVDRTKWRKEAPPLHLHYRRRR